MTSSTIGAIDANRRFEELLQLVEKGGEITITRDGSPIARIIPVRRAASEATRRAAIAEMRKLAAKHSLDGLTIQSLRDEGRR